MKTHQTSTKEIYWTMLTIIAIFTVAILLFEYIEKQPVKPRVHLKQISLPEKIQISSVGDILTIESIKNDTITIGFNNIKHQCNWEDCNHTNEIMQVSNFISYQKYQPGTDGYLIELTHFMNPNWTYEQCEDYVFNKQ